MSLGEAPSGRIAGAKTPAAATMGEDDQGASVDRLAHVRHEFDACQLHRLRANLTPVLSHGVHSGKALADRLAP